MSSCPASNRRRTTACRRRYSARHQHPHHATQSVRLPEPTPPLVSPTLNSRRATSEVASPTASPPSAQSPSTKDLSPTEIAALVARGDSFINVGDIASARLFYERAANAGYGLAALRLGTTFDPSFLTRAGLRGLPGDTGQAAFWYDRARDLGDKDASQRLKALDQESVVEPSSAPH